jgi:hypothetical protein
MDVTEKLSLLLAGETQKLLPEVQSVDLFNSSTSLSNFQYRSYYNEQAGKEHYKLLAFVASLFPSQTIYDIGTHFGGSSVALSTTAHKVISYDIVEMKQLIVLPSNVEYKIGDFRKDPDVLNSPFIFVDVDPHDGIQERDFHSFFLESKYKGIVLWDDIRANREMHEWWSSIQESDTIKKVDLSTLGHWSGTGMIVYG